MEKQTGKEKKETEDHPQVKGEAHQKTNSHGHSQKSDDKDQKIAELTDMCKRVQAEFQNYKSRVEEEKKDMVKYAARELISRMLPLLDHLELAIKHKENQEEFVKGVELIFAQMNDILEQQGLSKIPTENQKFDPYLHEALLAEESDKEKGTILEEFMKGYKIGDKVIRHSKVKVAK